MDAQYLAQLFATTYNPNPNVRKAAELEIRKVSAQEGMLTALLQIIGTEAVDITIRQACAVYLKNRVQRAYFIDPARPRPDQTPIPTSDRAAIKESILSLIITAPSRPIRVQLASCLKTLVSNDFPEQWPGLLDNVTSLFSSEDMRSVYGGLVAHLEIIKACRYRLQDELVPKFVPQTLPSLVALGSKFASNPSPESAECLHVILKTYYNSTSTTLSQHQQSPQSIVPWGQLFFQVVNMQLPAGVALSNDLDEREKDPWWKAKKWAYATLNRLFDRYGNPSQLPSTMKEYKPFAEHFVTAFAPEIFKTYLHQVELYISKQTWLSKRCLNLIFSFFASCVKPKSTWQMLKPHVDTLVSSFIFPQLCFDDERMELWNTDPVEYVRFTIDEFDTFTSPASAATSFLLALAQNRTKTTFMSILAFINNVLGGSSTPNQKYGALNMTVALGGSMMRHSAVKPNMENFLQSHVLPEFQSPHGFMRAIACDVVGTLERFDLEWAKPENLEAHLRAVTAALDDSELAVRVAAALALTHMVRHEPVRQVLSPGIGKIMQDLFKLSDETDLDMLTEAMETYIEVFQDELLPVAAELTARLCESYVRLMGEQVQQQGDVSNLDDIAETISQVEDDKTFALMGVTKTIQTIISALQSVENSREALLRVQEHVVTIVKLTLENKAIDLYDNTYELVDALTFNLRHISPSMWSIYELTYALFKGDAVDYFEDMLPSLDNFISFGKDTFIQRPEYVRMALDIYNTAMTSSQLGESDRVNGCKLAESILLNLRGHIDEALPSIMATAVTVWSQPPQTKALRLASLEVLVNSVLYNPVLALQILENQGAGALRTFFDKWFVILQSEAGLPRVHDKKLSIFALCALLEMDPSAVPATLHEGWAGIVGAILNVFKGLPKAVAAREALIDAFEPDTEDIDEAIENLPMGDNDEEDVFDEDTAYLEMLAQEGARLRAKHSKPAENEDSDNESFEDDSIDEELGFETPLDRVDPYVTFKRALTTFQMSNSASYQAATTSLGPELQTVLMEVMATAEAKEAGVVVVPSS
ncbi:hypothetical protein BOTBODRAFT_32118 [Botryobasidium botryosum FD-172 SS1]|uniref:Importin N-terminal domain-containing protein n=1 Tax=Botryobasidium botryosum (strain FD-172 SS1) TaxID=930990 RepID=A0A067MHV7_BOTB1|nr:hypothetical protein BOTBODRAFT_32118 [Botryobasidium botryosum FD-172 SS1]